MSIRQLGRFLRERPLSVTELVHKTIADIEARENSNSFITRTFEQARAHAAVLDRELVAGTDRGALHGIPIAHKDNFYTAGVRTTAGSLLYRDFVPEFDADVVTRLAAAGTVSLGKTNLHELAFGITSKNPHFGFVRNPLDPARIPGGSSGGSAALIAAGFIPAATGTDTGGSLRIPASYCGIVGFKPTFGMVSRSGIVPLAFSLDTIGPLGSSVDDCALLYAAMSGRKLSGSSTSLPGLRIGVPRSGFFHRIDPEVRAAVERAIASLANAGAIVSEVRTPDLDEMNAVARIVQLAETAALYANHRDSSQFGTDVWALVEQGRLIAAHEYVNAQRLRTLLRREFDTLWQTVDMLVTPTTPVTAPAIESSAIEIDGSAEDVRIASTRLVRCFNLLGEPAISIPCGHGSDGLPVGLQLVAAPHRDQRLLQTAAAVEALLASSVRA